MTAPLVIIMVAVVGVLGLWTAPAHAQPAGADNCATCHLAIGDARLEKPAKDYARDVHKVKGFGCIACHGGNEKEAGMGAMDPGKGYIGKPGRKQVAEVCAHCHSDATFMKRYNPSLRVDQATEYATSVHGRKLREADDPKVATCVSCHPAHSIRPPSDPTSSVYPLRVAETCGACHGDAKYMEGRRIPTDQLAKYKESVHGKAMIVKGDLSAPTCNDCHGNHGAAPPGITWVGNVCGQCHTVMADLFRKSVHAKAFVDMGTPGCATCHDNHAIREPGDRMLGLGGDAVCTTCHAATDKGGQTAGEMRALIDGLAGRHRAAHELLDRAEHAGMEVSQAKFDLNSARDSLVKARSAVHAFTVDAVRAETTAGTAIADKAHARGLRALGELAFRRKGLFISLVIILAVIAGLLLKIRQVDRRGRAVESG
jgi:predicted CXXCH cytochrome family protein